MSAVAVGYGAALSPMKGAGAIAVIGVGFVVLRRPAFGAYMLVALAPALSGLKRGLPVHGFRLSEVMIAGIAGIIMLSARRTPKWGLFDWMAFSYVLATAVVVIANVERHHGTFTADIKGTMFGPLQFFLLYRSALTALPQPGQRARAIRFVMLASIPVSILTLMQQFNVAGVRSLMTTLTGTNIYATTVGSVPRATGPFPHWHGLAGYVLLIILLGVSVVLEPGQRVMRKRYILVTLAFALAALVQTASLAPMLAAVAGVVIIGVSIGQGRRVFAWLGAIAVVGALLFGPLLVSRVQQQYRATTVTQDQSVLPQTIVFRLQVWKTEYLPVIEQNLVTGYGPTLPPHLYFHYAESLYVTLLLRGGVPLLLIYLGLMTSLALRARDVSRSAEQERRIVGRVVLAAVPLMMTIDTIATYFLDSGPAPLLWALAGLMAWRPLTELIPARPPVERRADTRRAPSGIRAVPSGT
jgi:hypothetical protein